ncbi:MAG: thermonuclease family protein [Gemmatimonadota bacterium]|nr:thermonuclease family protein [Gemmatimonadota bacterium]
MTQWCAFSLVALLAACQTEPGTPAAGKKKGAGGTVAGSYPHYADRVVRVDKKKIRFRDGDTFRVGGLAIRILGIDTPEMGGAGKIFDEDQPYGRKAGKLAGKLLTRAAVVEYLPHKPDRYGRLLAHVFIDGELFGVRMIEAHLAYETVSRYGDNGFPDLAGEFLQAAHEAGTPRFMEPRLWRLRHRKIK